METISRNKTLRSRLISGGIWLGAGNGAEQGLRFLRNIILTRLLAPEVFGVMALVLSVNMAIESFADVGIKKDIIQKPKGEEQTYLNCAWWIAFFRSIGLYAIVYVGAPWISGFYDNPDLVSLLRVAFLSSLFDGAMSSRAYVSIKQMNFKRWAAIYHGGGALGILTTILLAFVIKNVWALVIGVAVESAFRCTLSHLLCPFRPRLTFSKESSKELFGFIRGVFGLGILYFIFMRSDVFVIGKLLSSSDLGLYSMAVSLAQIPFQFMNSLMDQMAMPAFSEMQTDNDRINRVILNITSWIAFLGFPFLFFVAFYGRDLLNIIYGPQYATVALPFAIIASSMLMRFCSIPIAQLYFAIGRPELLRYFTFIRAAIIIVLIFPAVKWFGLVGAASAGLIAMLVGYFFQVARLRGLTLLNLWQYAVIFLWSIIISLCVVAVWIFTKNVWPTQPFLRILPGIFGCLLAYSLALAVTLRSKKGFLSIVLPLRGKQLF